MDRCPLHHVIFSIIAVAIALNTCLIDDKLQALVIGSKTLASAPSFSIFPNADTTNTLLGFARFENGFMLQDATTSCTHECYMPVSGTIFLNKGRLTLKRDFVMGGIPVFLSAGRIEANKYAIELPKHLPDFNFPETTCFSLGITTSWHVAPDSPGDPDARTLDWSFDDNYLAMGTRTIAAGRELRVGYFNGLTITTTVDVEIGREVSTVRWHPTKRYLAAGLVAGSGNELIIYEHRVYNGTLPVLSGANLSNDIVALEWHPSGNYIIAGTTNTSGELVTYPVSSGGVVGSPATTNIATSVAVNREALSFSPGGNQIAVGLTNASGTNQSELLVYNFNGSLTLTTSLDIGVGVQTLDWNPTGSYIAVGLESGSNNIRLYDASSGIVREVVSARIGEVEQVFAVHWDPTGTYLAVGTQDKPVPNPEFLVYYFDKENKVLIRVASVNSFDEVWTVRWSRSGNYLARGHQPTSASSPYLVVIDGKIADLCPLIIKDGALVCNSDVNIQAPIHFIGACKINGRGKRLAFNSVSELVVRPGSSLVIEDAEMQNILNSSIRCLDDTGTVTLKNCILTLGNHYTFSRGSMLFEEDVVLVGTHKFNYTTRLTSTIASRSTLRFDFDTTFSYAPLRANQNLIFMTDASSKLYLEGCTLHSTRTGLHLANGTLIIDNKVTMSSEAKHNAESLRLNSNLTTLVRGGATMELFGKIRYD